MEENNFGIRKRLLEYDDVMNSQREVIYTKRRHALLGERLEVDIANMMYDVSENLVDEYHPVGDFENFSFELMRSLSIEPPMPAEEFLKVNPDEIVEAINHVVIDTYSRKEEAIAAQAFPVIKEVYEKQSHQYENIVVPISDGTKVFQVITNLQKAAETQGKELVKSYEKSVILMTIDEAWKEHLREMDDLRQSVQAATYEQKDPLLIYKFESFELFKTMINRINRDVIATLMKGHIPITDPNQVREAERRRKLDMSNLKTTKTDVPSYSESESTAGGPPQSQKAQPVRVDKKVGRNDPCPCGSGKKYKHCHGRAGGAEAPAPPGK